MAKLTLGLRTTAPTFLKGSDPKGVPEFRVPSIRGQLRYWLRALVGVETTDTNIVWKREAAAFGSTEGGSPVTLRLSKGVTDQKNDAGQSYQAFLLPHRDERDRPSPDKAIKPETPVILTLLTRPGVPMPDDVLKAVQLWLLLGGVGKRSRRMMGGLRVSKFAVEGAITGFDWMDKPDLSAVEWVSVYRDVLGGLVPKVSTSPNRPAFPTLHPQHACVLVGKRTFEDAAEANRAFFRDIIRSDKFRSDSDAFGFAGNRGRRASPVIAQVRRDKDGQVFPILTILRSDPVRPNHWDEVMKRFVETAKNMLQAELVYGDMFR